MVEPPVVLSSALKRSKPTGDDKLTEAFLRASQNIAAPKLPGAADLGEAAATLEKLFSDSLDDDEMMNCMDYLQANPLVAGMWNRCGEGMKKKWINRWKVGV